jgi:hypothetical protein
VLEVATRTLPPEKEVVGTEFDVDEKTGRVRVAGDYFDSSFEGAWYSESVPVPGLVFDRARREVRYESEGASVTCAVRKHVLFTTTYPVTPACRLSFANERGGDTKTAVVRLSVDQPERSADVSGAPR